MSPCRVPYLCRAKMGAQDNPSAAVEWDFNWKFGHEFLSLHSKNLSSQNDTPCGNLDNNPKQNPTRVDSSGPQIREERGDF